MGLPDAASQSLAVLFLPAVRTKSRAVDLIPMVKGGEELAGGRIPELGAMIRACRQNSSAVRTKRRVVDLILVLKGGEELARGRIPELSARIRACRQNPSAIRT